MNKLAAFLVLSAVLLVAGSPQVLLGTVSYLKSGTPYFDTDAVVEVREDAGEVILPVKVRGGDPGAFGPSFAFTTIDGTAKGGSDYLTPSPMFAYVLHTGGTGEVKIPILNPSGTGTEVSETFTMVLTHPGSTLPLTLPTNERQSVVVRIIDSLDDMPPPSPVLAANLPTTVAPGKPFVITGVATDDKDAASSTRSTRAGRAPRLRVPPAIWCWRCRFPARRRSSDASTSMPPMS